MTNLINKYEKNIEELKKKHQASSVIMIDNVHDRIKAETYKEVVDDIYIEMLNKINTKN